MRTSFLLATVAVVLAGCGGGQSNQTNQTTPTPVQQQAMFTNSNLESGYNMTISGSIANSTACGQAPGISGMGLIVFDGKGAVLSGSLTVQDGCGNYNVSNFTGHYQVNPDGTGTLEITGPVVGGGARESFDAHFNCSLAQLSGGLARNVVATATDSSSGFFNFFLTAGAVLTLIKQ
jgi:hypothetical protein